MDLNGNDKLFVDASTQNQTNVLFQKGSNNSELKLTVYKTGVIDFQFINEFGDKYETSKPASDFKIANLVYNDEGKLVESQNREDKNFVVYRSNETKGSSVIHVPSL